MDFKDKIQDILRGMTGDNEKDLRYLREQMDVYKDDENSTEIIRALGRKMYELLPDNAKDEVNDFIGHTTESIEMTIEEAMFQLKHNHDTVKAENMFASIIREIEGMFTDDEASEYRCFDNIIEKMIYEILDKPQKEIRKPTFNYMMIYYMYGYCLIDNNKLDEAEDALFTAHKWSPVNSQVMFELAEIYKVFHKYEEYIEWTKKAMKYSYKSGDIARGYRNLGYYYIDIEKYQLAADLFYFSQFFNETEIANSELFYISQKIGELPKQSDIKELKNTLDKEGIQFGANNEIISIIHQLGVILEKQNKISDAINFFMLVYDLSHDQSIRNKIDELKKRMN